MSTIVKLDEKASNVVRKELAKRIRLNLNGRTRKDVASDLILRASECKEKKKNE